MKNTMFLSRGKGMLFKKISAGFMSFVTALTMSGIGALVPVYTAQAVAQTTIFSDGFESEPNHYLHWTSVSGKWGSKSSGAHSGGFSAEVKGNTGSNPDLLVKNISTSGNDTVTLSFWYKADGLEANDDDRVEVWYTTDGSAWTEVPSLQIDHAHDDNQWHSSSYAFPSSADNNANFGFRFAATLDNANDKIWLDDVLLTGVPLVVDTDQDGIPDDSDNCPAVANADQADMDSDGIGDVCDNDVDGDDVANDVDNCETTPNADQADADQDGIGDVCEVAGCTDEGASNYDPAATDDDGSCAVTLAPPAIAINDVAISTCGTQDVTVDGLVAFQDPTSADSLVIKLDGVIVVDDEDIDDDPDGVTEPWSYVLSNVEPGTHTVEAIMYDDSVNNTNPKTSAGPIEFEIEECSTDITIVATKVVCDDAELLPQGSQAWMPIDETTAYDFLDSTKDRGYGCEIDPEWEFQWTSEKVLSANTDQMAGELEGWNTFSQSVTIPMTELGETPHLSVREVFQPGHIPFSRYNEEVEGDFPTAELYCSTDGKNYDNMEWINNPEAGATYYCVAWNVPVERTSEVTMCKYDEYDNPLSGWQLALLGEKVGEVEVLPDGNEYTIAGAPAGDYVLRASGAYVYRSGGYEADAAFSERKEGDPGYDTYPYQPWRATNPATEHLGVRVNGNALVWGEVFSSGHIYYAGWNPTDVSNSGTFQITDDAYGDNSGSVLVEVFTGYTGVTGDNGCVTFSDVPYGEYDVEELLQVDWQNVSGLGLAVVDDAEEQFVVENRDLTVVPHITLKVAKVVCEDEAYLPDWGEDGIPEGGITENTAAEFLAQVNDEEEVCYQVVDWQFQWAPGGTPDPEDNVGELESPWTTFTESTTIELPDLGENHLVKVREVWHEAYLAFAGADAGTEPQASAEMYCDIDTLYYDNVDYLENVEAGATYNCIAFNVRVDVCENIEGIQEEVPKGYYRGRK
jgi:hypothetical protein